MLCKYCGKNMSGISFECSKCREKYMNAKRTHIPNGLEYIEQVLAFVGGIQKGVEDTQLDFNKSCKEVKKKRKVLYLKFFNKSRDN